MSVVSYITCSIKERKLNEKWMKRKGCNPALWERNKSWQNIFENMRKKLKL